MRMRGKQKDCAICGENPTIRELVDYEQFCNNQPKKKVSSVVLQIIHKKKKTKKKN
jgi:adenylyltransferase/sulfurtransferase